MQALAFVGVGAGLVPLGLLILLIVAVTGGRHEPDPAGERPAALYYAGVMFIALFTLLFAVFTVVASLLNLTTDEGGSVSGFSVSRTTTASASSYNSSGNEVSVPPPPPGAPPPTATLRPQFGGNGDYENNRDYANALRGGVIALAAAALYAFHDRRRRRCVLGSVGQRVSKTYLYTVSLVSVVIALIATVTALYAVVKVIAPGVTSAGSRGHAGVELGQTAFLAVAAGALFLLHLRAAEPDQRDVVGIIPPEPPGPPPPVPPEDAPTTTPRKRTAPLRAPGR
ncbi:MAG: hypothetical protein H0W70_06910 [Actinobacteria bacterium]|nr:hypothetical protein [Actinomycetota bacterium]